jgi:branched-chain amino acid transport system permease protein
MDPLSSAVTLLSTISVLLVSALGLAVTYGLMRVINFAHGDLITIGAYATYVLVRAGVPLPLAMLAAPVVAGALGVLLEVLVVRRLYGRPVDSLLATFAVSLILSQLMLTAFGSSPASVPNIVGSLQIGDARVEGYLLVLVVATLVLLGLTWWLFTRTLYGLRARVVVHSREQAAALGINPHRLNLVTFGIGAALAGAAGALLAPLVTIEPFMGQRYVAQAFLLVISGGAAPVTGTLSASGLLGTVQHLATVQFNPLLAQAALLVLAIGLVRFVPRGLSSLWRSEV